MITDVVERAVPMGSPMRNAYIDFSTMTTSVVVVRDETGLVGYGFSSNGRYAQSGLLGTRIIPRLLAANPEQLVDGEGRVDPERAWAVMMAGEKPGGHGDRAVAVGAVDMALWDLAAKQAGEPLARLLARRYGDGQVLAEVPVYAAGGYYHGAAAETGLRDELRGYLDQGYTQVKMKIGGATLVEDLHRLEAALSVVGGDASRLAVDANGRFSLEEALAWAGALAPYGLRWYEEPGDPLDYELTREVAAAYEGALATGENLFSCQEAINLLRYGGLRADRDLLQMDPSLAYGLPDFCRTLRAMDTMGWPRRACVPHGGHQFNLAVAAGLGLGGCESYPSVFAPFGGFADSTPVHDGKVGLPDLPGIGVEDNADLYRLLRQCG